LLASKIEVDVERPLREFANSNREMAAMSNMQGNLSHIARDVDRARQKLERLQSKGDSGKIASATGEYENTQAQWESQAPYVFENLQAADESRWNHLRDVLTQFQTHEIDQVEKHRISAEQVLNILLSVETADEIKTFTLNAVERSAGQPSSAPIIPPPSRSATVASSLGRTVSHASEQDDGSIAPLPEKKEKGAFKGLKRLGTVMGRRRESKQPQQLAAMSESPERKPKSSPFNSFSSRLGKSKETVPTLAPPGEQQRPRSPLRMGSEIMEAQPKRVSQETRSKEPRNLSPPRGRYGNGVNGVATPIGVGAGTAAVASHIMNGGHSSDLADLEPPRAAQPEPTPAPVIAEPERDHEGYSVPSRDVDPITQAQQDAADAGETIAPQFNVNIRDAPVQDAQGDDAQAAINSLANKLQMVSNFRSVEHGHVLTTV
jgi:hypothetical protein